MPYRLLLADDSLTIQRVIKLTFADEDVEVTAVRNGDQAVAAIDQAPPDIVLADAAMPGRSGYDVARHLRSSPHLSHIPILLLTGAFELTDDARVAAAGCDGVLSKPFEPEVVIRRVRELLSRPRAAAPPPTAVAAVAAEPAPAGTGRAKGPDLESYFDRLDQAFAGLAAAPRPGPPPPQAPEPVRSAPPLTLVPPKADARTNRVEPWPPIAPAGEAGSPGPGGAPERTTTDVLPLVLSESQIEQIADRVIERLADRIAGGNLADIVASVTERLVREEIAAIKRH